MEGVGDVWFMVALLLWSLSNPDAAKRGNENPLQMNRLRSVNILVWLLLVYINHHSWFIGTRCSSIVVRSLIVMVTIGVEVRRSCNENDCGPKEHHEIDAAPANVIGLDQPYRKG